MIRSATPGDAKSICAIYNYYVLNTSVTFEEQEVLPGEMVHRITSILEKHPWLVYEGNEGIIGYAYASPWRVRAAYRHSVETAIYLDQANTGKGIGLQLYSRLLELLANDFHAVIGGIALPNPACIALHQKLLFEPVAHFKEVGFKFNTWTDVVYWQKVLRRAAHL